MKRRDSIIKILLGGAGFTLSSIFLSSCGKTNTESTYDLAKVSDCGDLNGLPQEEIAKRNQLAYVEKTPIADNSCDNCQLYLPPTETRKCGGCQLFKGPVKPEAYCTYWAPKVDQG